MGHIETTENLTATPDAVWAMIADPPTGTSGSPSTRSGWRSRPATLDRGRHGSPRRS